MTLIQTELHRHLDASFRTRTLFDLARSRNLISRDLDFEKFSDGFLLRTPQKDLATVLGCFTLFQKVFDRPEVMERLAFETVEDCFRDGTHQVELRFSPGFVSEFTQIPWMATLEAFEAGVRRAQKKYSEMKVGLICIASRDQGREKVGETVEFYLQNLKRFVGIDLAGPEVGFPCSLFSDIFKPVIKAQAEGRANVTIHAGEASGPESVWEAIEFLGARRIGHGIQSIKDAKLLGYLRDHEICLEICPSSNWITRCAESFENHPIKKLMEAGVPVSISTDDPGIFGVTLLDEFKVCREKIGMSTAQMRKCLESAQKYSFIPG